MLYVKGLFGNVFHSVFSVVEGQIIDIGDDIAKTSAVLELEAQGVIKIFKEYEDAVAFKFRGYKALALESLPHLNPGIDENGKSLVVGSPTMDIKTGLPLKKEYNYVIEEPATISSPVPVQAPVKAEAPKTKLVVADEAPVTVETK